MKLLPDDLKAILPDLYSQEKVKDPIVYIKYFHPQTNWTWFVTEGRQEQDCFLFFGYVMGDFDEWGYFTLEDLMSVGGISKGKIILPVERDLNFKPTPFYQLKS